MESREIQKLTVLFGFYFCLLETHLGVVKDSDLLSSDRAESWISGVTDNILRTVYWVTDFSADEFVK